MANKTSNKKEEEKAPKKFSLEELKSKMSDIVRPIILYTTEKVGDNQFVEVKFRHQINRIEAELQKGPIEIEFRGRGSVGLAANIADYYLRKQTDGYAFLQEPQLIRGFRPAKDRETGKSIQIPQFEIALLLEGPFVNTNIFEELKK
jgi:hypothetical protein